MGYKQTLKALRTVRSLAALALAALRKGWMALWSKTGAVSGNFGSMFGEGS